MWGWHNQGEDRVWPDDQVPNTGILCEWHYWELELMPDVGFLIVTGDPDVEGETKPNTQGIKMHADAAASDQIWMDCSAKERTDKGQLICSYSLTSR